MKNTEYLAKKHNFSLAFEQICSIIAIGKTKARNETINELILQTLVLMDEEKFSDLNEITKAIDGLFGLFFESHEIEFSVSQLIESKILTRTPEGIYNLDIEQKKIIRSRINEAYGLEIRVRDCWKAEIGENYPTIEFSRIWKVLKIYLAKAFQRHGIQTAALLDPRINVNQEYIESLSSILSNVVNSDFQGDERIQAQKIISDFMATTGNYPDRATFISQLADGAFTYFSLTLDPRIADEFRQNLNPLDLFLDTNFVFGILDLAESSQVAVSNELLQAIEKYKLPFNLYCHERTIKELLSSVSHHEQLIKGKTLSRKMSIVATLTRSLSGVEQKFHQKYAETGVDPETFFAPFHHSDELLTKKNILTYVSQGNRLKERSALIDEYNEFLVKRFKKKTYTIIDHDMTLLDEVRQKRSLTKSTLDAGALLITCDYSLYRFDWDNGKKNNQKPCTVLPNLFWQILRPFIPSDLDFDRSFAETFAIPEFRIIGSNASEACSKMLSLLASYEDFPEETAIKLLSNDLLINNLQQVENDEQFQKMVDAAIVHENEELLEEKASLKQSLQEATTNMNEIEEKLSAETLLRQKESQIKESVVEDLDVATDKISTLEVKNQTLIKMIISIVISVILFIIFQFLIEPKWTWLLNHNNTIALHVSVYLLLFIIPALIIKKWRKIVVISLLLPLLFAIIPLLDK